MRKVARLEKALNEAQRALRDEREAAEVNAADSDAADFEGLPLGGELEDACRAVDKDGLHELAQRYNSLADELESVKSEWESAKAELRLAEQKNAVLELALEDSHDQMAADQAGVPLFFCVMLSYTESDDHLHRDPCKTSHYHTPLAKEQMQQMVSDLKGRLTNIADQSPGGGSLASELEESSETGLLISRFMLFFISRVLVKGC